MEFFLALAALTLLAMLVSFFSLTKEDRALLNEQNTLPDDLRIGPMPLVSAGNEEFKQAA